jgi:hypothetical protein
MSDTTKADITNVAESARQLLRVISIRLAFLKAGEVHGRVVVPDVARRRTKYPFTRMPDMIGKIAVRASIGRSIRYQFGPSKRAYEF